MIKDSFLPINFPLNLQIDFEGVMKLQGIEIGDWKKAQDLLQTGEKVEVELISCSNKGFVVSYLSWNCTSLFCF